MKNTVILIVLTITLLLLGVTTQADSWSINYQAYLTDNDGAPVDDVVSIQFNAYNTDMGGAPLWTDTQVVDAELGLISTSLGNPANPFPQTLFDSSVFIGITINGEVLQPRKQLVSSAFTFQAANAKRLDGQPASDFDQSSEVQELEETVTDQEFRLTAVENSPNDITAVVAGTGLSGGAQSGSATLSLAIGGVTAQNMSFNAVSGGAIQADAVNSSKIQNGSVTAVDLAVNSVSSSKIINNSITTFDIADGAVNPSDLNPLGAYTVGAITAQSDSEIDGDLDVAGTLAVVGGLTVESTANIDGSINVSTNVVSGRDVRAGRDIVAADDAVIGGDLTVGGDSTFFGPIGIAYQQVQKSLSATGSSYLCNNNLSVCKVYSTSAQCPTGYLAVGGGVSMANSNLGKVLSSRPANNSSTAWFCSTQDAVNSPVDDFCYANCLHITGL